MVYGVRRFGLRAFCTVLMCLLSAGLVRWSATAGDRNPCLEAGNLTYNCGFDTFVDDWVGERRYLIPEGWWYYILAGEPEYRQSDDTRWGEPSLGILSDGVPFTAGIYQQVAVTPGVVYKAAIGWAAPSKEDFERKLGLDPTGGTDPLARTVIWGRSEWTMDPWPDLTVSARATSPTMTVFVWVHHPRAYGEDWIFLDAVGLWPDPSQPAATVTLEPSPTATRRPPTHTPSRVPLTNTPTASASATVTSMPSMTPSATATSMATETAQAAPTPSWTATPRPPTATPYPTRTPLPTIASSAQLVPGADGAKPGTSSEIGSLLWFVGIAAGVIVASAASATAWFLRRRRVPRG